MDLRVTAEQRAIRDKARTFARERLTPHTLRWDREEQFPAEELVDLARAGLVGMTVPQELGGQGAPTVTYALALMEIASACPAVSVTASVSSMVAETIYRFGTPAQRERHLPRICSGEYVAGAFALSEPGAGTDAGSLRTRAVRDGDQYVINGEKAWISSGTRAGVFVLWARTGEAKGARGITCFLVEPGTPGFEIGKPEDKLGLRASTTVSLSFDDCRLPATALLGDEGRGFSIAMGALDGGRIGIGCQSIGIGRAALEEAARAVGARADGPEKAVALAELGDLRTQLEAANSLVLRAAWLKDQGVSFSPKAAMAKMYASETANRICRRAVVLVGPDALHGDSRVEKLFRDSRVTTIYEGTSEVQRIVIARSLLDDIR